MESKISTVKVLIASSRAQMTFSVLFAALLGVVAWMLRHYTEKVAALKTAQPDYNWPEYDELWISVVSSAVLFAIHRAMLRCLPGYCDSYIKEEYTDTERAERIERHIGFLFRMGYFTFATCIGYWTVKDAPFLPVWMGGSGDSSLLFHDYPYQSAESYPYARYYMMLGLGYHWCNLADHLTSKPKKDFVEMLLHHFLTIGLIVLAYFLNYIPISVMILLRSDCTDIVLSTLRVVVDTRHSTASTYLFVLLLVSWLYLRLIVTPFSIIWKGLLENSVQDTLYGGNLFVFMLSILAVLELYWFILMIQAGMRAAKGQQLTDPNSDKVSRPKKTN